MFDGVSLHRWTKNNGLISYLSQVTVVAIDSSNNVWTANGPDEWGGPLGVSKFDYCLYSF